MNWSQLAAKQPPPPTQPQITTSNSPFKYTKEVLLSLYKESPPPAGLDASLPIFSQSSIPPVGNGPLTDVERPIWESGNLNSEVGKRNNQQKRGEYKPRGRGGRTSQPGHHNTQQQQQQHHHTAQDVNPDAAVGAWQPANRRTSNFNKQLNSQKSPVTPNDPLEPEDTQISDDIWDLPQKGEVQGTFANGAFLATNDTKDRQISPLENQDWRKTEAPVEALTNSFATMGRNTWEIRGIPHTAPHNPPHNVPVNVPHVVPPVASERFAAAFNEVPRVQAQTHSHVHHQAHVQVQAPVETIWFYKDPQGNIQGPFTGHEMQQWFDAGYFPDTLLVKVSTDDRFEELLHFVNGRMGGQVNFLVQPSPPHGMRQAIPHYNIPVEPAVHMAGFPSRVPEPVIAASWNAPIEPGWKAAPKVVPVQSQTMPVKHIPVQEPLRQISTSVPSRSDQSSAAVSAAVSETSPLERNPPASHWKQAPVVENQKSLKEIQEKENLERQRRQSEESRIKMQQAMQSIQHDPVIVRADVGPVWGGVSSSANSRTVAEIQQEEELRKARVLQAQAQSAHVSRRYAETASQNTQVLPYTSLALSKPPLGTASWAGKSSSSPSSQTSSSSLPGKSYLRPPASRVTDNPSLSSSMESLYTAPSTPKSASDYELPKVVAVDETLRWLRDQVKALEGKIDVTSFIEILAPLDDPYTITEIIHDAIGGNYRIVDPKKLAGDYIKRRHKQGRLTGELVIPVAPPNSAAAQRSSHSVDSRYGSDDKGFVQVVSKKKKSKKPASADPRIGAPVGVGGKTVVGALPK